MSSPALLSSSAGSPPISTSATASASLSSRPRRTSSSTNNNGASSASTRSSSMTRQRSRGLSTSSSQQQQQQHQSQFQSAQQFAHSYSSSPNYRHASLSDEKRQQTKFERLFGAGGSGTTSSAPGTSSGGGSAAAAFGAFNDARQSGRNSASTSGTPSSLPKSGIALTRRPAGPSSRSNGNGIGNGNGNGGGGIAIPIASSKNGSSHISSSNNDDDGDDYDESALGTSPASTTGGVAGGGSGKKGADKLLRCERCHKVYHHPQSLIKHRWQHTEMWSDASKYGMSKHQTVQALEAAVILANPDTLRLLPNDKSHWPAAVSPPTSGLLGSEKLNIEILRKQAEVNEMELAAQEKNGTLIGGGAGARIGVPLGNGGNGMQMYSKSMPAHVGRRKSGLAFSLHQEMMMDEEEEEESGAPGAEADIDLQAGETGAEDDDDAENTESEDEVVAPKAASLLSPVAAATANTADMDMMDHDMFSLDISSSSPYLQNQALPPIPGRSGLSFSRHAKPTSSVAPSAERYTFLPTIPSSSSLHIGDGTAMSGMMGMSAIPTAAGPARNRSSSHTRSTRGFEQPHERSMRENSASSTDESGAASGASAYGGATTNTTVASSDDARERAVYESSKQSGKDAHPSALQGRPGVAPLVQQQHSAPISMSAPVLGFFTERSPVSTVLARQQSGQHTQQSPTISAQQHANGSAQAADASHLSPEQDFTPLEAQAAEILSSSYQSQHSQQSFQPRSFGGQQALGRSPAPGFHPYHHHTSSYHSPSPLSAPRPLPSSYVQSQQIHSSSPSTSGQAFSFGQAPLGGSYRSTSFGPPPPPSAGSGNGNGNGNISSSGSRFPMSPLARATDGPEGANNGGDDDEIMDMDL